MLPVMQPKNNIWALLTANQSLLMLISITQWISIHSLHATSHQAVQILPIQYQSKRESLLMTILRNGIQQFTMEPIKLRINGIQRIIWFPQATKIINYMYTFVNILNRKNEQLKNFLAENWFRNWKGSYFLGPYYNYETWWT